MAEAALAQRSPWAGCAMAGQFGRPGSEPGVVVEPVGRADFVLVAARPGSASALIEAARALGIDLPTRPKWVQARDRMILWAGPDQWLVRGPSPEALRVDLAPLAASAVVVDQSHARALLTVGGPRVRDILGKGLEVDLHPRAFATGDVALTTAAQIPALVWQTDDRPTFALAFPRSYAQSAWHWLTEAASEYGYRVEAPAD